MIDNTLPCLPDSLSSQSLAPIEVRCGVSPLPETLSQRNEYTFFINRASGKPLAITTWALTMDHALVHLAETYG